MAYQQDSGLLIYLIIYIVYYIYLRKKKIEDFFWYSLFYFYICFLIELTIFPIPLTYQAIHNLIDIKKEIGYINKFTLDLFVDTRHFLYNIVLFLPFGFFINMFYIKTKRLRKTLLISLMLTLTIEMTQFLMMVFLGVFRDADINDVIANTLGGGLGFCIFILFKLIKERGQKYEKST